MDKDEILQRLKDLTDKGVKVEFVTDKHNTEFTYGSDVIPSTTEYIPIFPKTFDVRLWESDKELVSRLDEVESRIKNYDSFKDTTYEYLRREIEKYEKEAT